MIYLEVNGDFFHGYVKLPEGIVMLVKEQLTTRMLMVYSRRTW